MTKTQRAKELAKERWASEAGDELTTLAVRRNVQVYMYTVETKVIEIMRREAITDIDEISDGVLWELKSATGSFDDYERWIVIKIVDKFKLYLQARKHLTGYESAPIGFRFTNRPLERFKAAVEARIARLRAEHPDVVILLEWASSDELDEGASEALVVVEELYPGCERGS